jgi:hypothetical protein
MPLPRSSASQWPLTGERRKKATLQYATITTDAMGGRSDPTWTDFGTWYVKATVVPFVVNETEATSLFDCEGPYRRDLWDYFAGGTSVRVVVNGQTLKVLELENPLLLNRTIVAHCGKATNT